MIVKDQQSPAPPVLEVMRKMIVEGGFAPGQRLPTREELVRQTGASSVTLQRALDQLAHQGFVRTAPRQGTFVNEHPPFLCHFGVLFMPRTQRLLPSQFWTLLAKEAQALHQPPQRQVSVYFDIESNHSSEALDRLKAEAAQQRLAGVVVTEAFRMRHIVAELGLPSVAFCTAEELATLKLPNLMAVDLDFWALLQSGMALLRRKGCRRVAVLTVSSRSFAHRQRIVDLAKQGSLECPPHWVLGVHDRTPLWVGSMLELLFAQGKGQAPDGLIISDDHLVEHTLAHLMQMGVRVPQELTVVAHCNYPAPPAILPISRLGYDVPQALQRCLDLLSASRRGLAPPRCTRILPRLADDAEQESSR